MNQDRELIQAACREHLYYFVQRAFETLHPGKTFIPAWHIETMCRQLEKMAQGENRRLLITLPRSCPSGWCRSCG